MRLLLGVVVNVEVIEPTSTPQGDKKSRRASLRPTCFPIVPVINGYAQPGDEICVLAFTEDYEPSKKNIEALKTEVSVPCAEKGLKLVGGEVNVIMVPYGDSVSEQLEVFQKMIDRIDDGNTLYVCVNDGITKSPIPAL